MASHQALSVCALALNFLITSRVMKRAPSAIGNTMNQLCTKPASRKAAKDTADTVSTYGNWVDTWLR